MASSIHVGSFTRQAGTGAQAVTGIGFLPVALILFSSNQTATGFTDGFHWHAGITDGTFSVAKCGVSDDNVGTSEVHRSYEEGAIYRSINSAGTLLARATFTSFDADGFTLNWATNDGIQSLINYIAIGGDVDAKCGVFDCPTAAGSQAVTGVGFLPTAALLFPVWNTATSESSDFLNSPAISWTSGVGEEGGTGSALEDGAAAANTFRFHRTDKAVTQLRSGISGSVGNIFFAADLTSFDADGFTLNWTSGPADSTSVGVYYLALAGIQAQAGVIVQPTSTGEQAVTDLGFTARAVLFQTAGLTAAQSTPQADAAFWFGAGDGTRQRGTFLGETDAADPTVNARAQIEDKVITLATPNATGSSSTTLCAAELLEINDDGFVIDWTTADATQRQILYLALGDHVIRGSLAFGVGPTVKSTRSVLFSLDGNDNELDDPGTLKVAGTLEVTEAIRFPDGVRQTFNPNGTNAGLNVGSHAGDPSAPVNGDLWYDSSAGELTARINGANVDLGSGGGGALSWSIAGSWDHAISGDTAQFDTDVTGAEDVLVLVLGVSASVSTIRALRISTDGGSTYLAGATDYVNYNASGSPSAATQIGFHDTNSGSARSGSLHLHFTSLSGVKKPWASANRGVGGHVDTTSPITHVRVIPGSGGGNMTAGQIFVMKR